MEKTCPFCVPEPARLLVSEGLVLALRDGYPVGKNLGPRFRRSGTTAVRSLEEQSAMLAMLQRVRALLDAELRPDGYNIGINDGAAAGQTVMHVHMHVIPRYRGDRPDLGSKMRGGSAGSFRRRPTIGAAGANERSARRQGPARVPAARAADFRRRRGCRDVLPATRQENVSQFHDFRDTSGRAATGRAKNAAFPIGNILKVMSL